MFFRGGDAWAVNFFTSFQNLFQLGVFHRKIGCFFFPLKSNGKLVVWGPVI